MTARTRLLAYIYIVLCGGCIAAGIVLLLWMRLSGDQSNDKALVAIAFAFLWISLFCFIPGLVGGLGLLRGRPWGRVVIIVISVLVILAFPIGTALGCFGLWVLLGPDSKVAPAPTAAERPRKPRFRAAAFSPADQKRYAGLLLGAAGVGAAFFVMIGTGYRVTGTPGSPIGDVAYFAAIGVLVLVAVVAARSVWLRAAHKDAGEADPRDRQRFEEEQQRGEEERRRREVLATDPVRRSYAERIQRGESWSDEQIEYDLNANRLATCEHLQPIEREMRAAGIEVRLKLGARIGARCRIDAESLRARFALPPFVDYAEPRPEALTFHYPLPAMLTCAEHSSAIEVVHHLDATPETPVFPSTTRNADASPPADPPADRFTQLRSRILPLAQLIGAPSDLIPTYQRSLQNGLPHIEIDGETYHYVHEDRGQEFERFSTTSLEELLYRIFNGVAYSMAPNLARPHQKPGEDFRREMFKQQLMLLGRLNAEWVSRCAAEHQKGLAEYPFVDEA